jgi:DNA (cytosine-5)-methyltransferase 1
MGAQNTLTANRQPARERAEFLAGSKTVAEFFAGIGLMRMGLEAAGWRVVWANDLDPDKESMYRRQFVEAPHFLLGDVHEIDPGAIPTVDMATASFPCTDLSLAGRREGLAGAGSGAYWGFVDCIKRLGDRKPKLILLENVPAFLTSNKGRDFRDACAALNGLGYSIDVFVVDAACFVPQSRQRMFVVGSSAPPETMETALNSFFPDNPCRPPALINFIHQNPEILWNIRDLPLPPRRSIGLEAVLEDVSEDSPLWWNRDRASYLLSQMSPGHRRTADAMIDAKKMSFGTVFRRVRNGRSMAELRTDGVAGCLRTPKGGSGRQILFAAGFGKFSVRLLSPRECARLMGADDYRLAEDLPLNKALFGFGDAVCVSVVEWIANRYLNPLYDELTLHDEERVLRYGSSQAR